ncbi:MAG: mevalonate kinase [Anaerolineaceae bacterium]|nr:mevalonate kinase [Anaerolineaceae bacterium]
MNTSASAPAKTILFGEHAVVYGEPAIAIPLSGIRTYAEIHPNGKEFRIISESAHLNRTYGQLIKGSGLEMLLSKLKERMAVQELPADTLKITGNIPIASGLGSGAALSVAVIRAFAKQYNLSLSTEDINQLAYQIEKIYHGNPSGIDNTTIAYEQPILFSKNTGFRPINADFTKLNLLVIDSGICSKTIDVVTDVRNNLTVNEKYIREIGSLVRSTVKALDSGNETEIGQLMTENHRLLQNINVSCPVLDEIIQIGISNGALGGKLTGAGRGGNALILAKSKEDAEKLSSLYVNKGYKVIL